MAKKSGSTTQRPRWMAALSGSALLGLCAAGMMVSPLAAADELPPATSPPTGGDPGMASLAQSCYSGSMSACDNLTNQSHDVAQNYYNYAFSCGGRLSIPTGGLKPGETWDTCLQQFPNNP